MRMFGKWLLANWERLLFALVGSLLLLACGKLVIEENVTQAAVLFGLAFLSFIYSNLARFKRFKGLGFEAEMWEDKQKEAANLIQQLRGLVKIYTHELVLGKVKSGRNSNGTNWANHWETFNEFDKQHRLLGQDIDFTDLKREMDDYFLFEMTMSQVKKINEALFQNKLAARIDVSDRSTEKWNFEFHVDNPFELSQNNTLAKHVLEFLRDAKRRLESDYGVDPIIEKRLEVISKLYESRPVTVTNELIEWASGRD